ncbi:hypothetical protein BWQ96_00765 [Gracilariopsis chorda]|uniref:Uncharacterized protein n=1 Tax=Gracilariopsis chorda TaxID=448386 RepID=A0A2V3J4X8_9FLOR|nr:hypothetical protein BWQ96_00765 [Gracilariopsis chorda]|eukprot:PXF49449.1 hypothetical protein BWQ96_00765 [Gracilariopsis chorda]
MTLADVLKPSVQLLIHAESKGSQLGAAVGLAVALPGVSLFPNQFNSADAPPLVAVARVCGVTAAVGATAAAALCISRLLRLSKEDIKQRAQKLTSSETHHRDMAVSAAGAAAGLALMAVRVSKLAQAQDESAWTTLTSKECVWDCYCFGIMGSALGMAIYKGSQFAANKLYCTNNDGAEGSCARDATATAEMQQVSDNVDNAVNEMTAQDEQVDKQQ